MEVIIALIGSITLIFFVMFYSALSWGIVCHQLYYWFVFGLFPGLPQISLLHFIGFTLFMSAITHKHSNSIKDEYLDEGKMWGGYFLDPWIILFISWLVHLTY